MRLGAPLVDGIKSQLLQARGFLSSRIHASRATSVVCRKQPLNGRANRLFDGPIPGSSARFKSTWFPPVNAQFPSSPSTAQNYDVVAGLCEAYAAEGRKFSARPLLFFPSHLITRRGFPCRSNRMSRPRLAAETRGRNGELALERPVKSGFGLIADFGCDLCHRITGRSQHLRSQLKSPAREVCHWRLVEVMVEALRQHRA